MILLLLILTIINLSNQKNSIWTYVFPFYNFTLHDTPVVLINTTYLSNEKLYYDKMKRVSLIHFASSSVISIGAISIFPYIVPISAGYWSYHAYMLHKSSHLSAKCDLLIKDDDNLEEQRFPKPKTWSFMRNLPNWIFEPSAFVIHIWVFVILYTNIIPKGGRNWKTFIILIILLFYSYSFFQHLKKSIRMIDIEENMKLKELKWKCHVVRMTFFRKVKKSWLYFRGLNTDEYGYLIDKECQNLERQYYDMDVIFIDILYKTITQSFITILNEILSSISFIDKVLLIGLFLLVLVIRIEISRFYKNRKALTKKISSCKNNEKEIEL